MAQNCKFWVTDILPYLVLGVKKKVSAGQKKWAGSLEAQPAHEINIYEEHS